MKSIRIPADIHRRLMQIKYDLGVRSVGEVIEKLLEGANSRYPAEIIDALPAAIEFIASFMQLVGENAGEELQRKIRNLMLENEEGAVAATLVMEFFRALSEGVYVRVALKTAQDAAEAMRSRIEEFRREKEERQEIEAEIPTEDKEKLVDVIDEIEATIPNVHSEYASKLEYLRDLIGRLKLQEAINVIMVMLAQPLPADLAAKLEKWKKIIYPIYKRLGR